MSRGLLCSVARLALRLPRPMASSDCEEVWVPMRDGVRLSTVHVWPIDPKIEPATILIRTPYGSVGGAPGQLLLGRLLAENGYHVLLQDVRGRYRSEGEFYPFVNEAADGADTLDWIAGQSWCNGQIGLFGASYLAYCAWAACGERPELVSALSIAIGAADLYPVFHPGGAFSLATSLEWGVGVGEHEGVPARKLDLARGLSYRPIREADRVVLRATQWYRDWIDHPERDEYWERIRPQRPSPLPPTLMVGGWYDFFLAEQLREYEELAASLAERMGRGEADGSELRLVVGPWSHGLPAHLRWLRHGFIGRVLRETLHHFERHLQPGRPARGRSHRAAPRNGGVLYFVLDGRGGDWCEADTWPPETVTTRRLHLSPHPVEGMEGRMLLSWEEPAVAAASASFEHDPEDPFPTRGGSLIGIKGGARDQRELDRRDDSLSYGTTPLVTDLLLAGPVRLVLHATTDELNEGAGTDFTARLILCTTSGRTLNLCDGVARIRRRRDPDDATPIRVDVELGHCAARVRPGERLRLEVAAANHPRYASDPAWDERHGTSERRRLSRTVHHDRSHPSFLELPVVAGEGSREHETHRGALRP